MPPVGSVPFVLAVGASAVIFLFLWRMAAAHFADSTLGRAMAAIYS